jgi:hypothetical protein
MWEKRAFLGNIADAAFLGRAIDSPRGRKKRPTPDLDLSGRDISQTGDRIEEGGLTGTGGSENGRHSRIEGNVDIELEIR